MKAKGGRVKPTQFCFLQKDVIRVELTAERSARGRERISFPEVFVQLH